MFVTQYLFQVELADRAAADIYAVHGTVFEPENMAELCERLFLNFHNKLNL